MEENQALERLVQFISSTSRLMKIPKEHVDYFAELVTDCVREFAKDDIGYDAEIITDFIRAYARTLEEAAIQSPQELFENLPVHAAIITSAYLAREYAVKDSILRQAFFEKHQTH